MDNKTQTKITQELAPANGRHNVDWSGNISDITHSRLDFCTNRKIPLDFLAARHWPGISDISIWVFKIGPNEQP